jgi:hypothetical protein
MEKWLTYKRLNIVQVLIYYFVLMVYLLGIKIEWFDKISFSVLIIGAVLSAVNILIRFIYSDKLDQRLKLDQSLKK